MLDPAPVPEELLPDELLRHTTYLTPNEIEIEALTGIQVTDEASVQEAGKVLLQKGVDQIVLTHGANGAWRIHAAGVEHISAPRVEALDSTAAGDAFNGGLATALARKLPLLEAIRNACLVGASSVTRMGAQPSLPTLERMEKFSKALEAEWK
jgi:ribokinase